MLKRLLLAMALVLGLALPVSADVNGVYGGLKFIDSIQNTGDISTGGDGRGSFSENTVGGGIFLGYDFYPQNEIPIRTEIEYAIRSEMSKTWHASDEDGSFASAKARYNVQTLFLNAYFDFHNSTAFTPYIGAGVGLGFIQNHYKVKGGDDEGWESVSLSKLNTVFAWNAGVGCAYAFTENFSADLAYRFVGLGHNEISGRDGDGEKYKISTSPFANEFSLGLRFTF